MVQLIYDLHDLSLDERMLLYGPQDRHIHILEDIFGFSIETENDSLLVHTDQDIHDLTATVNSLIAWIRTNKALDELTVHKLAEQHTAASGKADYTSLHQPLGHTYDHQQIYAKTLNQKKLFTTFQEKDMTFVIGPAGTGKTYLSMVYAVNCIRKEEAKRIVITRPVLEAGESLGYLPGDMEEKINPYLRPVYDALDVLISPVTRYSYMEKGIIEIAPLAYMRGRTLDNAVVILDEAQNTTEMQMKMFLTRMGFHSKVIVNGDLTQTDLNKRERSGLADALERLKGIDEIGFVELNNSDVVRHPLVRKILERYNHE